MRARRSDALRAAFLAALCAACAQVPAPVERDLRAALLTVEVIDDARLAALVDDGFDTVVLVLENRDAAAAAARVRAHGLRLAWWIEVGRCPQLADAQPQLLASLQGHDDWRRAFPGAPAPVDGVAVKAWPWVPVASVEGFAAQRQRVSALLAAVPPADLVFLNDLQAAPSACGCGSSLCRWTTDYGPLRTNTALGDDAAARFCAEIQRAAPRSRIVPVWVTECEADDPACGSVPCYDGTCWKAFRRQWQPLVAQCEQVAVLLSARALGRDPSWPSMALAELRQQTGAAPPLIAVLDPQTPPPAGVSTITAFAPIEQSFEPR